MQTKNKTKLSKILTTLLSILVPVFVVSSIVYAVTTIGTNITTEGDLTVDTNTLYVDSQNHRVGIGTTTPLTQFQVGSGATLGLTVTSTGNVGIGTTNPQSNLYVPDGKYAQFADENAGPPPAGDCDSDTERGRQTIDTTNNRLYICNGAIRGWDYIDLTDEAPFVCGTSTIEDGDGNTYNTVQIGDQCWMAENLDYDGDPSGNGCKDVTWVDDSDEGWCGYYTGGPYEDEGLLYQWSAAMNGSTSEGAQGFCPTGWHIPTDAELYILENYLAEDTCTAGRTGFECDPAGSKLAGNAGLWNDDALEAHEDFGTSGFSALPAGDRYTGGSYYNRSSYTYIWSSSEGAAGEAWLRALGCTHTDVLRNALSKANAWSVRCLKD
jgi:uncharacterized protein (TIGR02145 family)